VFARADALLRASQHVGIDTDVNLRPIARLGQLPSSDTLREGERLMPTPRSPRIAGAATRGRADSAQLVFDFADGNRDQADLLGGKGANLAEMTNLGLPVPPGFTVTTEACRFYLDRGEEPQTLRVQVTMALRRLEDQLGRRLGDVQDPLLVSVRSGAKYSMPGMMETVLNVGLNDYSVKGLAESAGNERFAWDSYRRLVQMFGRTVLDIPGEKFEAELDAVKSRAGVAADVELTASDLRDLVDTFKHIVFDATGRDFPQDPREQLDMAMRAVFESWNTDRARLYRRRERIPPATSARTPAPVSASPATRPAASSASTATTWSTRRARTSSPGSATP